MHFVTGGAFNGKGKWVKQHYSKSTTWLSAYHDADWLNPTDELQKVVVLEGLEHWVKKEIDPNVQADILLDSVMGKVNPWLEWENKDRDYQLILIGTDISKGIVPINKYDRLQRDIVGWLYQRLVKRADRVDLIWYGIAETLKNSK